MRLYWLWLNIVVHDFDDWHKPSTAVLVSLGQTTDFLQGVIACSISTLKNKVWYGSQAQLMLDTYMIL